MDGIYNDVYKINYVQYIVLNSTAWKTYKKSTKEKKSYCTVSTVLLVSVKLQGLLQTRGS